MTTPLTHGTNDNANLRGLAEAAKGGPLTGTLGTWQAFQGAANPATVLGLLDKVDALTLERDAYAHQLAQERHTDARIARVKAIRQETGCGLKEALDIVNGDVALAATTARTLRDQALDALAEVDRLRAENEDLRAERDGLLLVLAEVRASFAAYREQVRGPIITFPDHDWQHATIGGRPAWRCAGCGLGSNTEPKPVGPCLAGTTLLSAPTLPTDRSES